MRHLNILFIILFSTASLKAAELENSYSLERRSYPAEATSAIFGRVFGSEGQGADIDYVTFDMADHNSGNTGVRSILVPGWGQAFNGDKRKGALLFGTTVVAGALAYASYSASNDSYDDYKSSARLDDSSYDDYSKQRTLAIALTSLTGILWGYAIYDAYASPIQVSMNSQGAEVTWQRKF